jgi:hypothetical protein
MFVPGKRFKRSLIRKLQTKKFYNIVPGLTKARVFILTTKTIFISAVKIKEYLIIPWLSLNTTGILKGEVSLYC